ncbi:hypothetical protein HDU98_007299 [Podochytrium sp. JEL0797]|nr:hypothetical protein HDU98_007299 [Podochytrium sp. JEL0797]
MNTPSTPNTPSANAPNALNPTPKHTTTVQVFASATAPFFSLPVNLLDALFPLPSLVSANASTLLAACCPDPTQCVPIDSHFPTRLRPALLPFQKRALAWMLQREGALPGPALALPPFVEQVTTEHDESLLLNRFSGNMTFSTDPTLIRCDNLNDIQGGILADEMGLGKTVEILALICAHPATTTSSPPLDTSTVFKLPSKAQLSHTPRTIKTCPSCHPTTTPSTLIQCFLCTRYFNASCRELPPQNTLFPTAATLIITPQSILSQWVSELHTHAPHLSVHIYRGRHAGDTVSARELSGYDVVVTTYPVLQKEVHLAQGDNMRSRRAGMSQRVYERPRSPLVEVKWWRVCLDEAQMVESSCTATAKMARLVPRVHAWVVTGTPVHKEGVLDLYGLCVFLRVVPFDGGDGGGTKAFQAVVERDFTGLVKFFQGFMWRNTKESVKGEVELPVQRQVVVELEFGGVERSCYEELERCCVEEVRKMEEAVLRGGKKRERLVEDGKVKMRQWLLRLRQICCHPQIGEHNKTALGGKLGTIDQVLDVMRKQSTATVVASERTLITLRFQKAHLHENLKEYDRGIAIYEAALVDIRARIRTTVEEIAGLEGRGVAAGGGEEKEDSEIGESATADLRSTLSHQLSSFKQLEHQALFFIACCYNSLENEEMETEYYAKAEALRREILADFEGAVERLRGEVLRDSSMRVVMRLIRECVEWQRGSLKRLRGGGIVVRDGLERVKAVLDTVGKQWDVGVSVWRARILELVNSSLENVAAAAAQREEDVVPSGSGAAEGESSALNPTGEEYTRGLDVQQELDVLMDQYPRLLAERRELLTGVLAILPPKPDDVETSPFERECETLRSRFALKRGEMNLTALVKDLKEVAESAGGVMVPEVEKRMVGEFVRQVGEGVEVWMKCYGELQKELNKLRRLANARIDFFRHLQHISDSVENPARPDNIQQALLTTQTEIMTTETLLASQISRCKYLHNLSPNHSSASIPAVVSGKGKGKELEVEEVEGYECLVCKEPFEEGWITECGHFYCDYCMRLWIPKHRKCAMCKQRLTDLETQLTKVGQITRDIAAGGLVSNAARGGEVYAYPRMEAGMQSRIQSLKLDSTDFFGTKTDFVLKHILSIVSMDPGAKCLIFSQWDAVLNVVAMGCDANGIGYVKMEAGAGRGKGKKGRDAVTLFREEEGVKVFMLNAKSQSSGLTLVNASHVFLVEPVVNLGLEMQGED